MLKVDISKNRLFLKFFMPKGINVSCRTINGESFVFREDTDELIQLDDIGSVIWDQINGLKAIEEIAEYFCQHFEGNRDEIRASVVEFIETLREQGVVVTSEKQFEGVMISAC